VNPAHLLARVGEFGFRISLTPDGPQLDRTIPGAEMPPELLADLKANRAAIVAYLTCRDCGRDCSDRQNREVLKTLNVLCLVAKCPYRERLK
jgi:hypothetical protein